MPLIKCLSSATKLLVGANMGISAACICIAIQLEHLASNRGLKTTAELRRDRILAVLLCWILPVFYMIIRKSNFRHFYQCDRTFSCCNSSGQIMYFKVIALTFLRAMDAGRTRTTRCPPFWSYVGSQWPHRYSRACIPVCTPSRPSLFRNGFSH
jgi:hypothetical protein